MIKKPEELDFSDKKIRAIIAGLPGTGKTTLALSAPKPLLIDLDNGIDRVEARHRKDTDVVSSYQELLDDLVPKNLNSYETIIIDTGGKLLELMKGKIDSKGKRSDGSLSLQGYGSLKKIFSNFIKYLETLNKHVIYIFHATEVRLENDMTGLRIRAEGSAKDFIWDNIDFGGFIEMKGKKRTINFSPCERYYAKGTHNLKGSFEIKNLDGANANEKNDLLTKLFAKIISDLDNEVQEVAKYDKTMLLKKEIESVENVESLNAMFEKVTKAKHYLTSKEELWNVLNIQAQKVGAEYDKSTKTFCLCDTEPTK